ncbi:MAG: alpha/beta hydrolase, partial [Granulicella sp.]
MDIFTRIPPVADQRIPYGKDASQFGDLWIPSPTGSSQPFPVVVFFHGGWWQSEYNLAYAGHLCAALKADGLAVWSVEYRRCGATGGGWPATFQDAAAGFDHVATLAKNYSLDLSRVVAMGHSAGGHLAYWLAGRHHIDPNSPLYEPQPKVAIHGLIALAGAVDLRLTIDLAGYFSFAHDRQEVYNLMGGEPQDFEDRYRAGNPGDLL